MCQSIKLKKELKKIQIQKLVQTFNNPTAKWMNAPTYMENYNNQSIKAVFSHTIFEFKYLSYHLIKPLEIFTRGSYHS